MGKKFDVNTFNKLLHGWAQKGNLMSVKLLFKLLKREGLEPDMGTYAALLHGYGKFDDVDGVQSVIKEMEEKVSDIQYSVCICLFQNKNIVCQGKFCPYLITHSHLITYLKPPLPLMKPCISLIPHVISSELIFVLGLSGVACIF